MTDPILPDDLANGLVDGTVDISSLPAELRGVAEVFAAAHRPAASAELAGMAAAVQRFSTVVTSTSPAAAIADARSTGVIAMFGTRITKRAAVIVGATVLFAGTAAAAAGGVLPTPFSDSVRDFTPPALARAATTSTDGSETTQSTQQEAEAPSSSDDDAVAAAAGAIEDATPTSYPGRDFGRCTAWTNGAPKNTAAPAFADLLEQAKKAGMDVDAYCVAVIAAHVDDDTSTSNSTETSTSNSIDDKGGQNNGGQNNGGQNNGGQNNGGHGADDPATSVSTPSSVSNPSISAPGQSAPGTSVDSGSGQNGKGKGGGGGNDSATSTSNP